ncbi:MAG: right-handed parallel beta-helix repeat-containing protein [Ilumatobacteraceae bacterium]
MKKLAAAVAAASMLFVSCGGTDSSSTDATTTTVSDAGTTSTSEGADTTAPVSGVGADGIIEVPDEAATIQEAVDAATAGDLVLISPGTYKEAVDVTTDEITIRGLDRNTVVLDGNFELDNGIRVVGANGVAIENLTAQNFTKNGFFWTGVDGYRGSFLTAYRNGDYGIYAFDSVNGQLEDSYGAGSPDAGFYIGQCFPCNAVMDRVTSEYNGLGYSGTNAGGNLLIVNSTFRYNRAGVVPNSGSYELCYPQRETTLVGNIVYSNNQPDTPAIDVAILAMGNGILSAGGVRNTIERNLVYDHNKTGIGLVPFLEEDPNDDLPTRDEWEIDCATQKEAPVSKPDGALLWDSLETRVVGNVVSDSRVADIAVDSAGGDLATFGNCWKDNTFTTSAPLELETLAPCDAPVVTGDGWTKGVLNVISWLAEVETAPKSVDYKTSPMPPIPTLPSMPDAATAPAKPATDVPYKVDVASIKVPAKP